MNFNKPTWAFPIAILGSFLGWHLLCAGFEIAATRRQAREQAVQDLADAGLVASRAFGHWTIDQRTKASWKQAAAELSLSAVSNCPLASLPTLGQSDEQYTVAWLDDLPVVTPSSVAGVWEAVGHYHDLNGTSRVYRVTVVRGVNGLEAADVKLLPAEATDDQKDIQQ